MGCLLPNNKQIEIVNFLNKWLSFKDNDWAMDSYRVQKTQFVSYLEEIELNDFKQMTTDLAIIYKRKYPY